jgi:hypothetical protein
MTAPTISATPKKALDQRATSRHDNAVRSDSPTPNRLVRSHDPAFGEKIFYVTEAANKQSVP